MSREVVDCKTLICKDYFRKTSMVANPRTFCLETFVLYGTHLGDYWVTTWRPGTAMGVSALLRGAVNYLGHQL